VIKPGPWEFMPFGGGDRVCVGQTKAMAEATYTIVRIAQRFASIECRDERDWEGEIKLTVRNANGCNVGLVPA
jgi:cytochrome P450